MKKILATLIISSSLVFAMDNSIGLDTLVGATIGVAIGNQVGKGNGRDVAKVAGGLLGAGIANSSRTPSYSNGYYDNNSYNNNYERSTTYVRRNYDDDYDRYVVYERRPAPPPVTIIYQNYDRYPNRYYYNEYRDHPHHHRDWHGR
jgi:uncharacterized protein YcfJ